MEPGLSIIIVNYNTRDLLDQCLASVHAQTRGVSFEVVVVDNQSTDGSREMLRQKYPDARLIANEENVGFGRANNQGVAASRGAFLMLLNSDTVLLEDTGTALVCFLTENPAAGVVGPAVHLRDGTRQPKTFGNLPNLRALLAQNLLLCRLFPRSRLLSGIFIETQWSRVMEVGWISGVCMVFRREAFEAVQGFDPSFFMYAEDIELCHRLRDKGWKVVRLEDHAIEHLCGGSSKSAEQSLRHSLFQQRNFLRLIDGTTNAAGRLLSRAILAFGLALRITLRVPALLTPQRQEARLSLQAAALCLRDLFVPQEATHTNDKPA